MEEIIYKLALSSNTYIGPKRYNEIKNKIGIRDFFSLSPEEQVEFLNIRADNAENVFKNMLFEGEKIYKICQKDGIKIIEIESQFYPQNLKNIDDAPFLLYMAGEFNYSIKLLAVVGTREATQEAIKINEYFVRELVDYGIGIVSGLARGHDGVAQKAALERDGYTLAVLGGGVDVIYPKENANLYKQIKQKGCIISEYPPGVYPLKQNFPLRNRIISGLSDAVFVIQAPEKSGSLITAKYAEAQGREVYTIPGNVSDSMYTGTNRLIQNGVKVVISPEEIAMDLIGIREKKRNIASYVSLEDLTIEERKILEELNREKHFDEIVSETKISPPRLVHILTMLEIKGYIVEFPGNFYKQNI